MSHIVVIHTGPGDRWPKSATRRRWSVPRTPAASASARTKQTFGGRERKCNATRPDIHVDEHVTRQRGDGGRRPR